MEENELNTEEQVKSPPKGILASLRYMGPGLILSAAIVGSGELIATTTLGAKAGFTLLWVILLGCMMKVAVQLEYGRFCIHYGLPVLQGWNWIGQKKKGTIHWSVYIAVLYMISTFAGQGGVLGGASQVVEYAFPFFPLYVWIVVLIVVIGVFVSHGKYKPIEVIATLLNLIFVLSLLYCVFSLQYTDYAFTFGDLVKGLSFQLPRNTETVGYAFAAFGITGVAAGEIALYPYWCLEKGYARWTGPKEDSPEWYERARGWTRVMVVDALVSMIVYTVATCAFYILGAAVLSTQTELADGNQFILQLSIMFSNVLGENAREVFMLCAFAVLFSTIFSNTAGFSRMWVDFFGLCRWVDWQDPQQRVRWISRMAWVFPILCGLIYIFIQKPLLLVIFMGICNSLFLLVVAYQTVIFRYQYSDRNLKPTRFYDIALWISLLSIGFMTLSTFSKVIKELIAS